MKLSICTYNVAMLPPPQGFSKRNRAREIGRQLLELSPDVICLQEVFDEGIREGFASRLKKADMRFTPNQTAEDSCMKIRVCSSLRNITS